MRTLTTETQDAIALTTPGTRPGVLVEIELSPTPLRLASRGDVSALGNDWVGWPIVAQGLGLDGRTASPRGSLILGDADQSITASLLTVSTAGLPVRVWRYDAVALAQDSNDAVMLFEGVVGAIEGGPSEGQVVVSLQARETVSQFVPRRYFTSDLFPALTPANKILTFNGEKYRLRTEA